jgi:hypothetical protein
VKETSHSGVEFRFADCVVIPAHKARFSYGWLAGPRVGHFEISVHAPERSEIWLSRSDAFELREFLDAYLCGEE